MLEEVLRKIFTNVVIKKERNYQAKKQLKQYRFQISTTCQKSVCQEKEKSPGMHRQQEEHPRKQQEIGKPMYKKK